MTTFPAPRRMFSLGIIADYRQLLPPNDAPSTHFGLWQFSCGCVDYWSMGVMYEIEDEIICLHACPVHKHWQGERVDQTCGLRPIIPQPQ